MPPNLSSLFDILVSLILFSEVLSICSSLKIIEINNIFED